MFTYMDSMHLYYLLCTFPKDVSQIPSSEFFSENHKDLCDFQCSLQFEFSSLSLNLFFSGFSGGIRICIFTRILIVLVLFPTAFPGGLRLCAFPLFPMIFTLNTTLKFWKTLHHPSHSSPSRIYG